VMGVVLRPTMGGRREDIVDTLGMGDKMIPAGNIAYLPTIGKCLSCQIRQGHPLPNEYRPLYFPLSPDPSGGLGKRASG
jgi:hypothetical protein